MKKVTPKNMDKELSVIKTPLFPTAINYFFLLKYFIM